MNESKWQHPPTTFVVSKAYRGKCEGCVFVVVLNCHLLRINADNDLMTVICRHFWRVYDYGGGGEGGVGKFVLNKENVGIVFMNSTSLPYNDDDEWLDFPLMAIMRGCTCHICSGWLFVEYMYVN